uniref:Uncharacterized protein n=2 Tax=environmental samples TaxID=651140 RepID=A0A075FSY9_9ARCH|nr:hypothetical protein [uncultured marine thaumarchaeote AD1000_46_C12]AIE94496.1 hypothetical protein [uncultured marine thaumarchaeote AD1000_46_F05]
MIIKVRIQIILIKHYYLIDIWSMSYSLMEGKNYSWSIRTGSEIVNQIREHPPAYLSGGKLDVKNNIESKFIALHVGIYWGLGVFIIKDYDTVNVMCDSKDMYEILSHNNTTDNQIINDKIHFINQLTNHRNLKINYQIIEQKIIWQQISFIVKVNTQQAKILESLFNDHTYIINICMSWPSTY